MKVNKYLLILLATAVAYALFEYYRPKPIDWTPSYQNDDKIPFGTQALFELMPDVMQQPAIRTVRMPIYNFLTETKPTGPSNYVFICRTFNADGNDLKQLFRYVGRGNNCLISAYDMPDSLSKALGFTLDLRKPNEADSTLEQRFVNAQLQKDKSYVFSLDDGRNYLRLQKTKSTTVLGRNARREPVFIRVRHGKGQFFIHNLPLAFTNYYVLNSQTSDYAFKAMSYLPALPTYWDEYQKQGRFDKSQQSIMRYVWSQPALNWAYYLIVFGLLFYILFAGKRTQRVIPVIESPRNTSLDFVKDVGRLYFLQRDHDNLARKKVQYFLADLRDRYSLNTNSLDREFAEILSRKSGLPADDAIELTQLLNNAQRSINLSEYDLLTLNSAIEKLNQTV